MSGRSWEVFSDWSPELSQDLSSDPGIPWKSPIKAHFQCYWSSGMGTAPHISFIVFLKHVLEDMLLIIPTITPLLMALCKFFKI